MVLYYSATGNTEFIAKEIARTQAIECGEITKDKEQYNFGKYKYVANEISK